MQGDTAVETLEPVSGSTLAATARGPSGSPAGRQADQGLPLPTVNCSAGDKLRGREKATAQD